LNLASVDREGPSAASSEPAAKRGPGAASRLLGLLARRNRPFLRLVLADQIRFTTGLVRPVEGGTRERADAAVAWLLRAQDASADRGVSMGYYPLDPEAWGRGWMPSYPETTGYIMQSLLAYAEQRGGRDDLVERAMEMARWEISIQMPDGAVMGGHLRPPEERRPAAFNTGMVLQGWTAAYRATGDAAVLEAARRAGDWLAADQGDDGHYRTHGAMVPDARIKTYNSLCSWALYRLGEDTGDERYRKAAVRNIAATVGVQRPSGWFAHNCLTHPETPLLHTIGYTLQGVLEVGILSGEKRFIEAARRGAAPLLRRISRKGLIRGRFREDWTPAARWSCLTGNAQLAVVLYRLFEVTGDNAFLDAAHRLTNFLKALQRLDTGDSGIDGAIAGSFPIFGGYMTAAFPNWATKYYLDALLAQERAGGR
jgi:rhamnogalacturonyl hydrolase YesR